MHRDCWQVPPVPQPGPRHLFFKTARRNVLTAAPLWWQVRGGRDDAHGPRSLTLTLSHSLSRSLSLSHTLSHTHSLSHSFSHTHTLTLTLTHSHTHSLTHSHTHTLTHSHTLSLSHTQVWRRVAGVQRGVAHEEARPTGPNPLDHRDDLVDRPRAMGV